MLVSCLERREQIVDGADGVVEGAIARGDRDDFRDRPSALGNRIIDVRDVVVDSTGEAASSGRCETGKPGEMNPARERGRLSF